jgi:hypothetical protein
VITGKQSGRYSRKNPQLCGFVAGFDPAGMRNFGFGSWSLSAISGGWQAFVSRRKGQSKKLKQKELPFGLDWIGGWQVVI